jgi:dihydroorotase
VPDFDVLISGGTVVDPASGRVGPADIGIRGDQIAAIGELAARSATRTIDARSCHVTPGLIDLHLHSYWGVNVFAFDADPLCLATGVTTAVDAGSAGSVNFPGLRRHVIERSRTRMLAFVHLAKHGVQRDPGELLNLAYADPEGATRTVMEHRPITLGVKVRLHRQAVGDQGRAALDLTIRAAEAAAAPVMVHVGNTGLSLEEIVDSLRPGDIVTHCYTPQPPAMVDERGRLREAVRFAHERGVVFDVAHANGAFDFDLVRRAIDGGLPPDTISTDLHGLMAPDNAVVDLPTTMSKFLALGLPLEQVIAACTSTPARVMGWSDRIGRLEVGREADVTVLELVEEPTPLRDSSGVVIVAERRLAARWTIRGGAVFPARDAWGDGGARRR